MNFDDLKRKVAPTGTELHKLVSCFVGTDEYTAWMNVFLQPENDTVEVCIEDDHSTYTFYTINKPKTKEKIND